MSDEAVAPSRGFRPVRFIIRLVLLVGVPLVAAVVGLSFYVKGGRYVETENAYVKANIVAVSTDIDGRVIWVGVGDNQFVEAGQELFKLDPAPLRLSVAQVDAKMDVVRTELDSLRADYRETLAQTAEATERVKFLERQLARQNRLRERKLGSEETYDLAQHEVTMAKRKLRLIEQSRQRVLARLGGDPELPAESHPTYLQAKAERDRAAIDVGKTVVTAPVTGIVSNMHLQVGEYVEEGKPIFSMIQAEPIWVEANLKETQLTYVTEGQNVRLEVDAYPEYSWEAVVDTIAPATGAEFALLPPQNATGNWVKVVQRIPVRVRIRHQPDAPRLRAGMTVAVSIDTERTRVLPSEVQAFIDDGPMPEALRSILRQAVAVDDLPAKD